MQIIRSGEVGGLIGSGSRQSAASRSVASAVEEYVLTPQYQTNHDVQEASSVQSATLSLPK